MTEKTKDLSMHFVGMHVVQLYGRDCSKIAIAYLHPSAVISIKAAAGDKVVTKYGPGTIESYRPDDAIYEVSLSWGHAFLNEDSFTPAVAVTNKSNCSIM